MTRLPLLIALLWLPAALLAKELGVHGRVYDITETDLLQVLQNRAQTELDNGQWDERVGRWRDQAKQQVARPKGVRLPRAMAESSHLYDPSIIVEEDIKTPDGLVLHKAGTRLNPLDYTRMSRLLVFVDGDDPAQVEWALQSTRKEPERYKIVLTRGNVIELMQQHERRLYFDQNQHYVDRLAIRELPAVVSQHGAYLRIDMVAIP